MPQSPKTPRSLRAGVCKDNQPTNSIISVPDSTQNDYINNSSSCAALLSRAATHTHSPFCLSSISPKHLCHHNNSICVSIQHTAPLLASEAEGRAQWSRPDVSHIAVHRGVSHRYQIVHSAHSCMDAAVQASTEGSLLCACSASNTAAEVLGPLFGPQQHTRHTTRFAHFVAASCRCQHVIQIHCFANHSTPPCSSSSSSKPASHSSLLCARC